MKYFIPSTMPHVDAIIRVLYHRMKLLYCQDKKTPLHLAAAAGSMECVNALMQHADIGATLTMQDEVSYNYLCVFDDIVKLYTYMKYKNNIYLFILCLTHIFKPNSKPVSFYIGTAHLQSKF